jgi:hypothetical protein
MAVVLVNSGLVIALVVCLRLEQRLWWCACGQFNLWSGDVWGQHNSQHLFDPYAFTHVLHGVGFWFILRLLFPQMKTVWQATLVLFLEAAWEVLENSPMVIDRYRNATAAQGYLGDTLFNALGDLTACMAGYFLAHRIGWKWSLAFFITTELIMAWWIRDNLLLNIVMLVWPIDAIKAWQGH